MLDKINECVAYINKYITASPVAGIILGTGLGDPDKEILIQHKIPYSEIPHFPVSTVEGHHGFFIIGSVHNKPVIALQGRFHFYEGYTMQEIIFPVRAMKFLGIKYLFLSNASGGMNPEFGIGDIMAISDHINFMPNPLIGKHYEEFGPRFPDMSEPYNKELLQKAKIIASKHNIKLHEGCYVAVTGPTYETPKEYEYFRIIGGDNIGMSTTPEVIAANQMNLKCFAVSVITDLGIPGKIVSITHTDVIEAAREAGWKISKIIIELIKELPENN